MRAQQTLSSVFHPVCDAEEAQCLSLTTSFRKRRTGSPSPSAPENLTRAALCALAANLSRPLMQIESVAIFQLEHLSRRSAADRWESRPAAAGVTRLLIVCSWMWLCNPSLYPLAFRKKDLLSDGELIYSNSCSCEEQEVSRGDEFKSFLWEFNMKIDQFSPETMTAA